MDIIMSCLSVSQCLPSRLERVMVIFKRKTMPKEKFPKGIVVQVNEKGLMDNQMMKIWIQDCYSKRPHGFFHQSRALLIMDSMCAHITLQQNQNML